MFWKRHLCDGITTWPKIAAQLRTHYTTWVKNDNAKRSMDKVRQRMVELRQEWEQALSQDSEPQRVIIAPVTTPRPTRTDITQVAPTMTMLPGTSTERLYTPSQVAASRERRRPTCKKCATVLVHLHELASNDDFAEFAASLDSGNERPIRLEGYGHCRGCKGRCPRLKRKTVYPTKSKCNASKRNWRLENLLPRLHTAECKRDGECKCDASDREAPE